MRYGKLQIEKVYWTTKEVSELTGVPDYTLRYWEKVVPYLQVPRNRAKNRAWRKQDIEFVKALKAMLMEENPEAIPTIVSQEPLLEDGAMPQPVKPIQPISPDTPPSPEPIPEAISDISPDPSITLTSTANADTSSAPSPAPAVNPVQKKVDEQTRKPDHEVLLKLRSELLLAMSKLRQ